MHPTRRALVACIGSFLLMSASPVLASDPSPSPQAAGTSVDGEIVEGPTIHAEMLAGHEGEEIAFVEGAKPEPLRASSGSVSTTDGVGGIAALPNGLAREVFGYLPYWALTDSLLQYLRYDLVSTISYFAVPAKADGTLQSTGTTAETVGWRGWTSSAMTGVISNAHARGVRVALTVTMMAWNGNYTDMTTLLNSATNRSRLAAAIAGAVTARGADGVNLDFEPVPNSLQAQYTAFVRELRAALGSGRQLTVAVTGGAATWDEGYDLAGIVAPGGADALMVMGYDFNWAGSARAGGVAPVYSPYTIDLTDAMRDFTARVSPDKLIWGVPYYGRAWTTQNDALNALTCKSSSICPGGSAEAGAFGRSWAPRYVDALDAVATYGRRWDSGGQVPWYTYFSSTYRTQVEGYYDDAESLGAKYDLVAAKGMRGIGIWHLLMDVSRTELWGLLTAKFSALPFTDIAASPFVDDIIWLFRANITNGCGGTQFCPGTAVTRDQMASFLARALALPAASRDYFSDDAGSPHEADINRIAEAGISLGCGGGIYCPSSAVTREQMAAFLHRALGS